MTLKKSSMTKKQLKLFTHFSVIFQQKFSQNSAIDSFLSHLLALRSFFSTRLFLSHF
jgi:hypothetical protein